MPQHVKCLTHRCNLCHSRYTSQHPGPINAPISVPSALSSIPHSGLTLTLTHTVTTFDRHTTNAGIKRARHLTICLTPTGHK